MITSIWIDADNCPSPAKKLILSKAASKKLSVTLVANRPVPFDKNSLFKMIVCEKEKNAADNYIFENAENTSLVITRDLPLAQRLLEKNISVMNDRGVLFTKENIIPMLKDRELAMQLASIGVNTGAKWKTYNSKDSEAFRLSLEKILSE